MYVWCFHTHIHCEMSPTIKLTSISITSLKKLRCLALAGVAHWLECRRVDQNVLGSIPSWGTCQKAPNRCLCVCLSVCLSLSFSLLPSLFKSNEKKSLGEDKKEKLGLHSHGLFYIIFLTTFWKRMWLIINSDKKIL